MYLLLILEINIFSPPQHGYLVIVESNTLRNACQELRSRVVNCIKIAEIKCSHVFFSLFSATETLQK